MPWKFQFVLMKKAECDSTYQFENEEFRALCSQSNRTRNLEKLYTNDWYQNPNVRQIVTATAIFKEACLLSH